MINISKIGNFPVVEPNPDSIPEFLKAQPWAVWRAEPKDNQPGKFNKAPCSPVTGIKAGASKPELFGTFEQAVSALETGKYSGFGPILTGNGIVGFDIDNYKATFDQMPQVKEWVAAARDAGAYCELSPSGTGLRLYVRGQLPGGGRKAGPIEVYADTRFLTATGKRLKGCGMELIEGQGLIDSYLAMLPDDKPKTSPATLGHAAADPAQVETLAKRMAEKQAALWAGNWELVETDFGSTGYPSQSEADFALCGNIYRAAVHLGVADDAMFCTIDSVFECSGLMRDKWHRQDYKDRTIGLAMADTASGMQKAESGFNTGTIQNQKAPRLKLADGLLTFSEALPPPRDFVIQNLILAAKSALWAGLGGVSKSQLLMQAAICTVLGLPFMGKSTSACAALLLFGEEDAEEISRRVNAIAKVMRLTPEQLELVTKRLRAFPMVGLDTRLTKPIAGGLESSGFAQGIIDAATTLENECGLPVRLIAWTTLA